MTLNDYLTLSDSEKIEFQQLITKHLIFDKLSNKLPLDLSPVIDIETYYAARFRERESVTTITWPEQLSLKETVICRLKMMQYLLTNAVIFKENADNNTIKTSCEVFIKSLLSDVFKNKPDVAAKKYKWEGLDASVVTLLNCIYDPTIKFYEKQIDLLNTIE